MVFKRSFNILVQLDHRSRMIIACSRRGRAQMPVLSDLHLWAGKKKSMVPATQIVRRTAAALELPRLSTMTMSSRFEAGLHYKRALWTLGGADGECTCEGSADCSI
jgi:hypothetical protein